METTVLKKKSASAKFDLQKINENIANLDEKEVNDYLKDLIVKQEEEKKKPKKKDMTKAEFDALSIRAKAGWASRNMEVAK